MKRSVVAGIAIALITGSAALPVGAASPSSPSDLAAACTPSQAPAIAHCGAIQLLNPAVNWQGAHVPSTNAKGGKKPPPGGSGTPSGYDPADIQSAYNLAALSLNSSSPSQTVAIVDAYNDPYALSNLVSYRNYFKLPGCLNGSCLTIVNQSGGTSLPSSNSSWSEEISLDLDMVSAVCPFCHILLVEASSASLTNLGTAVNTAVAKGANVVSNSYGSSEFSGETSYNSYYDHPGVVITVSAGDSGYGVEFPAASPNVTAVGGTTLTKASNTRGWSETVWSGTGSGCSAYESNPGWQPQTSSCSMRTVADVAAVADPNTGVAVYDTYGQSGWLVFGGTSVASPIIASIYALAGNASTVTAASLYGASLNKVTSGSNGNCGSYLCNAADSLASGYNGPTGNGTPIGTAGF